jgi:urease accessory protein
MNKLLLLVLLATVAPVFAHPGHHGSENLQFGLLHPLTGPDHLLMLLGTGILASLAGRMLVLPLTTLMSLFAGTVGGHLVGTPIGVIKYLIVASLVMIGTSLLLISRQKLLVWLMPAFALAHGWTHGIEARLPGFWLFTSGVMITSALLLYLGVSAGRMMSRHELIHKLCGSGMIVATLVMVYG